MTGYRYLAAAFAVGALGAAAGCGSEPEAPSAAPPKQFELLLRECEAVADDVIAETVGGFGRPHRYFHGAVCMWRINSPAGSVDLTFGWFEDGSVRSEERTARALGYEITPTKAEGTTGFAQRRPGTPPTCGLTAPYAGVITWWVQGGPADPCETARQLMELTLQRNV
ncbi:DUF3558 domain-containing protein [Nocardia uniformis]|uniref:DUF3558 domain-containing protein n=1 Tax=Nocardia uniformis TaxID=53432 RepID=A0A849CJK2_9NOCA|nr:DUF3558 domain-containing protein [Nocardia uniformis]NNH74651.1 DUF3558 domain-containing protein [Nocardia uniformis]